MPVAADDPEGRAKAKGAQEDPAGKVPVGGMELGGESRDDGSVAKAQVGILVGGESGSGLPRPREFLECEYELSDKGDLV